MKKLFAIYIAVFLLSACNKEELTPEDQVKQILTAHEWVDYGIRTVEIREGGEVEEPPYPEIQGRWRFSKDTYSRKAEITLSGVYYIANDSLYYQSGTSSMFVSGHIKFTGSSCILKSKVVQRENGTRFYFTTVLLHEPESRNLSNPRK